MANRSAVVRRLSYGPKFAWVPTLGRHETATSFLSRLALLNGRSLADLKTETGIDHRKIDLGDGHAIRKMATLGSMGVGLLAQWSPRRRPDRSWSLHGQNLGRNGPDRTFFRWCPACVRADTEAGGSNGPYLRAEWQVPQIRSCDRHGIALVPASPVRRQFEPFHFAETIATVLPDIDSLIENASPLPLSEFEAYLRTRLDGKSKNPVWLDVMPFHAAAEFCSVVGAVANHGLKVVPSRLTTVESANASETGFAVIGSGPTDLRSFLSEVHAGTRNGRGVWGARASVGHVHVFLERKIDDEAYAPAIEVVRDFLLDTVPFDADDVLFGKPVGQRRVHTVRTASLQSGAHARTMRKVLVRTGHVDAGDLATHRDHHTTLDAEAVDRLLVDLRTALTTPKVIERTGIPRLHLNYMIEAGHLPSLTKSTDVRWAKHKFGLRDVDALVTKLFAGAQHMPGPLPGICDVMDARAKAVCTVQEIVTIILDGSLTWKGQLARRNDYMALMVDPEEIRRLVRREEGSGLTFKAAAEFTCMSPKSIKLFVDADVLETCVETNAINRCRQTVVTRASAAAFKDRYVSLFALSGQHGVHFLRMNAMMEAASIAPAFDPKQFLTTFFERAEADRLGASQVVPENAVLRRSRTNIETKEARSFEGLEDLLTVPLELTTQKLASKAIRRPMSGRLDLEPATTLLEKMRARRMARRLG
jgi:hypothetical protein